MTFLKEQITVVSSNATIYFHIHFGKWGEYVPWSYGYGDLMINDELHESQPNFDDVTIDDDNDDDDEI